VSDLRLSKKDAARVQRLLALPKPCLLCGTSPTTVQGIFQPTQPELWGGTPEKVRLLGYALCAACFALPAEARAMAVEGRIMARLVGDRNCGRGSP